MAEAVAPVSRTASLTFAKTGFPKWVSPAFFGLVPPTTLVPELGQSSSCPSSPNSNTVFDGLFGMKTEIQSAFVQCQVVNGVTDLPCFPVNP